MKNPVGSFVGVTATLMGLALTGCMGIHYTDQVVATAIMPPEGEVVTRVLAQAEDWRNSGLIVGAGKAYHIEAEGRWHAQSSCPWTGPDGFGAYNGTCWDNDNKIIQGYSHSALVGKVGENGEAFPVLNAYDLRARSEGILFLRINEAFGWCGDNEGFVTARVRDHDQARPTAPPAFQTPAAVSTTLAAPVAVAPRRDGWAVVIGISEYESEDAGGLGRLSFADNDARQFAKALEAQGWSRDHIRLLTNREATKRAVENALETWLRRARPEDYIVLFWASHGWPDPEDGEKAYFACCDSRPADPSSGYRMDRARMALEERGVRNVIVIADTCHSGKIVRDASPRGLSVVPALDAMQKNSQIPKGWVFIASADPSRKAYEDKAWNNGALTHTMLQGLGGAADGYRSAGASDGRVTLGELKEYVKDRMSEEGLNVIGARLEPFFYTTSGDPEIWNLSLRGQ